MDKYNHKKTSAHRRVQDRRDALRRWIIGSAAVTFLLVVLNVVLHFSANFPGSTIVSATGRSVDFTDFLIVTAAPLFLWVFGFNTWSVWSISRNSARIVSMLSQEAARPAHGSGRIDGRDSAPDGMHGQSRRRASRHAA